MSVIILIVWLLLIPAAVGRMAGGGLQKWKRNLPFLWVSGQILLWALFQLVCVPFVLRQKDFTDVVLVYGVLAAGLALLSVCQWLWQRRRGGRGIAVIRGYDRPEGKWYGCLWAAFFLLLLFQLVQAVRMTYGDGDDAYYVAVSTIAEESDVMYRKLAYTGGATELDVRHGLAPFPIWIAFLARVSGLAPVTTAHIAVPLALIPMTYGIFYLIGKKLFPKRGEKLPLFLVLTEVLVLFGDYSFSSAENFMIARSRQGKAAMGSIVFPMMVFLLLMILERIQEKQRVEFVWWLLLAAAVTAACLCSTLGAVLACVLAGVTGLCAAVCFRNWRMLLPMAACCIPAVCYAALYLLQE